MIFVTGGTGLLGNCIIRELLNRGIPVRALCRPQTSHECLEGLDVEIIKGDLSDQELLSQAVSGCSAIIHSAALVHIGWSRLEEARQVNVQGTRRIVQACQRHNKRLIYISTVDTLLAAASRQQPIDEMATHGIRKTPCSYVVSKTEAEQVVRQAVEEQKLDAVIIHPGFMLAPYDWKPSSGRMIVELSRAPLAIAPQGGCSLCDARDVASGVVNSLTDGLCGQSYILAGENMSYRELWSLILEATGKRKRVYCFPAVLKTVAKILDMTAACLPLREGNINGAAIAMGALNHFYSSQKAEAQLGYTCRPVAETMANTCRWLKQRHML